MYPTQPEFTSGVLVQFTFNLDFAAFDCIGVVNGLSALWATPSHRISLLRTVQGSVVADFWIADPGDGEAANRYAQLSSELMDPNSATSIQARDLGIPILRSQTLNPGDYSSGPALGLIIAAAVGGVILLILIVVIAVVCIRKHKSGSRERYTPLMTMNSSVNGNSSNENHEIGTPYAFTHAGGDSKAPSNLVSRESFARRQNSSAQESVSKGSGNVKHMKLIADIRDVGQGVLTGCKAGALVDIQEKDWNEGGDWLWVTINGNSGWAPKNHCGAL